MKKRAFLSVAVLSLFLLFAAWESFAAEKTHTNSIGMEFILIPAGEFVRTIPERRNDIGEVVPATRAAVTISTPFYLGVYEVTQVQWQTIMGNIPSKFKGRHNPVEQVSWDDAQEFIRRLNAKEGHNRYRLPTEAEWEHAARAGTSAEYSFGDDESALGQYAWYTDNAGQKTHPVGQKLPNPWGLYDMHGNVWEWVQDWYGEYPASSVPDPAGPSSGVYRVDRGGCWLSTENPCRSASRGYFSADYRLPFIGFRLALSPE